MILFAELTKPRFASRLRASQFSRAENLQFSDFLWVAQKNYHHANFFPQPQIYKRGFKNIWRQEYAQVNVGMLNQFEEGTVVDAVSLIEAGMVKNVRDGIRILGDGVLEKKLTVRASGFSKNARAKIEQVGGVAEVI